MIMPGIEMLLAGGVNNVEFIEVLPPLVDRKNLRAYHFFRDQEGHIRKFRYFIHSNTMIAPGIYCLRKGQETYEEYIRRHGADWTAEEQRDIG